MLDSKLATMFTIDMARKDFNSIAPGVRSLTLDARKTNLLVGTFGSEIYELSIQPSSKTVDQTRALMQSHFSPKRAVLVCI